MFGGGRWDWGQKLRDRVSEEPLAICALLFLCFGLSFGLSTHLSHEVVGLTAAHFGAKFA